MNDHRRPGACWLRCDLHVHTPFDPEKKFGENVKHAIEAFRKEKPQKIAEIASRFIEACRKGSGDDGIDLVALTDHNSIDGYRYMRSTFETIAEQDRARGVTTPVVLPGVEFSVGGERPIHFLTIFAAKTDPNVIDGAIRKVFGSNEPFDPKTGTPRATGNSVDQFLKDLYDYCRPSSGDRDLSFTILPAHADHKKGLVQETTPASLSVATTIWDEMRGHLRQWVITRRDWHGFETLRPFEELPPAFQELLAQWMAVRRGQDWEHLSQRERKRLREATHWPLIEASDPHAYEAIGTRFTWLKMEVPDIEGIRLSLLDPESRLRRMTEGRPSQVYPLIRRIAIRRTDFFENVEISLNPCLNTLIGGRGSGKSTILECLRYALDRARGEDFEEDESEIRQTVEQFLARKRERDFGETPGMLLPDYEVELELEVAARLYKVTRSLAGLEVARESGEGVMEPIPLDVRALIGSRILSQRQISRIARDPAAQRRELDALVELEFMREFTELRRGYLERIEELQVRHRKLKERAETLPARETEFQRVKDQIAFLERGGNKEILDRFREYQGEERWFRDVTDALTQTQGRLENEALVADETRERVLGSPEGPTRQWTLLVAERVGEALARARTGLNELAVYLAQLKENIEAERETKWTPGFHATETAYKGLQAEMEQRGVEFRQHPRLLQQRALLHKEVEELRGIAGHLKENEREIQHTRTTLVLLHEKRLAKRRALAQSLAEQDADVRLDVKAFGDRKNLFARREEWFAGAGLQERDWEPMVDFVFAADGAVPDRLHQLVTALRQDVEATRKTGRILEVGDSALAELLGPSAARLSGHFFNALQRGERIQLDQMERFLPEDRVEARVRDSQGEFKPIDQGSIGLKSTAILSLLLSAGNQPLVIDQPEDDLDNQYIYDVVVDLLRKRKFSRQILIATHNANIPVNGDAELIIALGVDNRLGKVLELGSIDRPEVKETVSRIMEGSTEAFRLRRERYGF